MLISLMAPSHQHQCSLCVLCALGTTAKYDTNSSNSSSRCVLAANTGGQWHKRAHASMCVCVCVCACCGKCKGKESQENAVRCTLFVQSSSPPPSTCDRRRYRDVARTECDMLRRQAKDIWKKQKPRSVLLNSSECNKTPISPPVSDASL